MSMRYYECPQPTKVKFGLSTSYDHYKNLIAPLDRKFAYSNRALGKKQGRDSGTIAAYRLAVIKWICNLTTYEHLSAPSCFNALAIIDDYICHHKIEPDDIQLLAMAALLVSSKMLDDDCLLATDIVNDICDQFSLVEIGQFESILCRRLRWEFYMLTPYVYVAWCEIPAQIKDVAEYICCIMPLIQECEQFAPHHLALLAIYIAHRCLKMKPKFVDSVSSLYEKISEVVMTKQAVNTIYHAIRRHAMTRDNEMARHFAAVPELP